MTKQKKDKAREITNPTNACGPPAPALNPAKDMTLDLQAYLHHLDGLGLTEEEALTCLQQLYDVALQFVYLGFNIHPVQQAEKTCGKDAELPEKQPNSGQNEVSLLGQFIKENTADFTDRETERIGEGVTE